MADGSAVDAKIVAEDGTYGVELLEDTGKPVFIPIEHVRNQRPTNAAPLRFYGQYRLPAELGGKEITLRQNAAAKDAERGVNRAEAVRAFPFSPHGLVLARHRDPPRQGRRPVH